MPADSLVRSISQPLVRAVVDRVVEHPNTTVDEQEVRPVFVLTLEALAGLPLEWFDDNDMFRHSVIEYATRLTQVARERLG